MKNRRTAKFGNLADVQIETSHVNNSSLVEEVIVFASETLDNAFFHDFTNEHDRQIMADSLDYFCDLLHENNIIDQYDIIFDKRNNKRKDMDAGKFTIEIRFKQKHCLNVTSVKYLIGQS